MMLLVKGAEVHAPEPLGKRDILAAGGKILAIGERIEARYLPLEVETIEAEGLLALPGFIDGHVHAIGGGGEGGYSTRTP